MTRPIHPLLLIGALGFFAGCSTPALFLDPGHPASTDAPEAATKPARSSLRADEATQRTHELLRQRDTQADAAEPAPTPPARMQSHEHH